MASERNFFMSLEIVRLRVPVKFCMTQSMLACEGLLMTLSLV